MCVPLLDLWEAYETFWHQILIENGHKCCLYRKSKRWFGLLCGSAVKESTCNAGDLGSIPGLGRSHGEGKGYPLQYSALENSMDCIFPGVAESDRTDWATFTFTFKRWFRARGDLMVAKKAEKRLHSLTWRKTQISSCWLLQCKISRIHGGINNNNCDSISFTYS